MSMKPTQKEVAEVIHGALLDRGWCGPYMVVKRSAIELEVPTLDDDKGEESEPIMVTIR